jgi:hypothetical protein
MATSRLFGSTSLTTRLPMAISPSVTCSSPAIILKRVDLPQPEGPSSTTNERSSMVTSMPCKTWTLPNRLTTERTSTVAMAHFLPIGLQITRLEPERVVHRIRFKRSPAPRGDTSFHPQKDEGVGLRDLDIDGEILSLRGEASFHLREDYGGVG